MFARAGPFDESTAKSFKRFGFRRFDSGTRSRDSIRKVQKNAPGLNNFLSKIKEKVAKSKQKPRFGLKTGLQARSSPLVFLRFLLSRPILQAFRPHPA
jgi:hypothetical protein